MDKPARDALKKVVVKCRQLLEAAVEDLLEGEFGIYKSGQVDADTAMGHLASDDLAYREQLKVHLNHIQAAGFRASEAVEQLIREVAFTHLNRFCAYKIMEVRKLIRESVGRGYDSNNVKFYLVEHPEDERLFNEGKQDIAYRHFLEWLGGTLSEEIGVLFSPTDPANRLLPKQKVLDEVLEQLNSDELKEIWTEDETIGWVYQYFTPDEMRRESKKKHPGPPPNSYELAFRNQFFTPSYIVQFLTDNTLGRTWYEMRRGETVLTERCEYLVQRPNELFLEEGELPSIPTETDTESADDSEEDLLHQPVYILHRPKKDPRELRVLDPACGSGHFLLYCFTLLQIIYDEAYDDPDLGPALQRDYPSQDDYRKAVPGLILAHNLHGIDIDLRAAQIAALALWLRAQRAFQEMGLKPKNFPKITRSNFICAEPMPGEAEMLEEFVAELPSEELRRLVREVFEKMQLAGEAGSLLKIEDEIRSFIKELQRPEQLTVFDQVDAPAQTAWEQFEQQAIDALRSYAEQASQNHRLQRQLFSEDAVQGFAFIDICLKKFDVVLMNPPFGDASLPSKPYIEDTYGDTKGDVYKTFVECFQDRLVPCGMLGIISNRTGFFLKNSSDWRERILLRRYRPLLLADLGYGVLDALVETAAYVLRNISDNEDQNLTLSILPDLKTIKLDKDKAFSIPTYQKHRGKLKRHQATQELGRLQDNQYLRSIDGHYQRFAVNYDVAKLAPKPTESSYPALICLRLLADKDKETVLKDILFDSTDHRFFVAHPTSFKLVPEAPFCYWVSEEVRQLFPKFSTFDSKGRTAKQGLATADDFQFVRAFWEVPKAFIASPESHPSKFEGSYCILDSRWLPFVKGGEYSPFYLDNHLLVDWEFDGQKIKNFINQDTGKVKSRPQNTDFYFRPGLTWSLRSASNFSPRILPAGCIFSHKGPAAFTDDFEILPALGILFSRPYQTLVELSLAAGNEISSGTASRSYEVGIIQKLPWPELSEAEIQKLNSLIHKVLDQIRRRDQQQEATKLFISPFIDREQPIQSAVEVFQRIYDAKCCEILDAATEIESEVSNLLGVDLEKRVDVFGEDAGTLCSLPDLKLDADFNELYIQSIHDTIRDEIEESGGNRQIAVKSFYASRRLEVLAQTLGTNPRNIAKVAAERKLIPKGLASEFAQTYLSYAVGCAFGRWDVRFATGERPKPELPDPFAPLPVYSPGMITPDTDLTNYPLTIDDDGILVDDPGHPDDIVGAVREVFELLWGDRYEAIEQEACEILEVKSLRDYFRKTAKTGTFMGDHIKRYTKSTKQHSKVPIYWLLQSSRKSYGLWVYYHRLDSDLLFKAQKYVTTKLNLENAELDKLLSQVAGLSGSQLRDKEKEIEKQEVLVSEIESFFDKLKTVADLNLEPDLNDGVLLNFAPLWELTPWEEPKKYWDNLIAGEYKWSSISQQLRQRGMIHA